MKIVIILHLSWEGSILREHTHKIFLRAFQSVLFSYQNQQMNQDVCLVFLHASYYLKAGPPTHNTADLLTPFVTGATLCSRYDGKNQALPRLCSRLTGVSLDSLT